MEIKKSLGLLDATFIVAGSMIGSGIFIVSSDMAKDLGSSGWLLFTWVLTGVITLFGALSYGELAAMFPQAGGQFVYIQKAFGRLPSFLYGWTVFTVIQTGVIAAVGVAFGKFTGVFFPILFKPFLTIGDFQLTYVNLVGVSSIIFLTYLNAKGVKYGKIVLNIFTSSKLIALFILIVVGIYLSIKSGFFDQNFKDAWTAKKTVLDAKTNEVNVSLLTTWGLIIAISTTIINSLFSSDAWNNVTFIAGEIKNPERNLPRSLFLGTFIVTIFYLLANAAYLGLLPLLGKPVDPSLAYTHDGIVASGIQFASESRVGTSAAYMMFGDSAKFLMAGLIMVSTFGCNNGLIMSGSRLFYAMSNEKLFFKKANRLNAAGVPGFALWIQGAWAAILCFSGSYQILIKFATFGSMIFYIVTIAGLFVLRRKMPDANRPYKAIGYPIIPFLYLIFALLICVSLTIFTFQDTIWSIVLILSGFLVYYFFFRDKED
ncbi:MAG: APC family permease [Flavobacteriia bacterium]